MTALRNMLGQEINIDGITATITDSLDTDPTNAVCIPLLLRADELGVGDYYLGDDKGSRKAGDALKEALLVLVREEYEKNSTSGHLAGKVDPERLAIEIEDGEDEDEGGIIINIYPDCISFDAEIDGIADAGSYWLDLIATIAASERFWVETRLILDGAAPGATLHAVAGNDLMLGNTRIACVENDDDTTKQGPLYVYMPLDPSFFYPENKVRSLGWEKDKGGDWVLSDGFMKSFTATLRTEAEKHAPGVKIDAAQDCYDDGEMYLEIFAYPALEQGFDTPLSAAVVAAMSATRAVHKVGESMGGESV